MRELWRDVFVRESVGLRPLCRTGTRNLRSMSALQPAVLHHLLLHQPVHRVSPREPVLRLC